MPTSHAAEGSVAGVAVEGRSMHERVSQMLLQSGVVAEMTVASSSLPMD